MIGFSVKEFRDSLQMNHVSLSFQGMLSQEVLTLVGRSTRRISEDQIISKRLLSLVVELSQNIHHYSAHKEFSSKDDKEIGVGIIAIGESADCFHVHSGNKILNKDYLPILERCDRINSMNESELRGFYKDQRRLPQREDKPGANIGLIDMVRKSGNPIVATVVPVDDMYSFLIMSLTLDKKY